MASSELEVLVLVSNDGERYEVSLEVAKVFRAVEAMLESEYHVMTSDVYTYAVQLWTYRRTF